MEGPPQQLPGAGGPPEAWDGAPPGGAFVAPDAAARRPLPLRLVRHPRDGAVVRDHRGAPLTVDRMLATQPLQAELATRPGPGNKRLVYLKGDAVTRLLNQVFGFDGWTLTILKSERLVPPGGDPEAAAAGQSSSSIKHHVAYTSHVRITIVGGPSAGGAPVFREDVGFGDATDRSFCQAAAHAQKSSITDGLKRAARHFGDRLGNSLYDAAQFTFNTAPKTQAESLDDWEKRWSHKYGDYDKENKCHANSGNGSSPSLSIRSSSAPSLKVDVSAMPPPLTVPTNHALTALPANAVTPSAANRDIQQPGAHRPPSTMATSWSVNTASAPSAPLNWPQGSVAAANLALAAVPITPAAPNALPMFGPTHGTGAAPGEPARPTTSYGPEVAAAPSPAPALTNSYAALANGKRPAAWSAHPQEAAAAAGSGAHPYKKANVAAPATTTTTNPYGSR